MHWFGFLCFAFRMILIKNRTTQHLDNKSPYMVQKHQNNHRLEAYRLQVLNYMCLITFLGRCYIYLLTYFTAFGQFFVGDFLPKRP